MLVPVDDCRQSLEDSVQTNGIGDKLTQGNVWYVISGLCFRSNSDKYPPLIHQKWIVCWVFLTFPKSTSIRRSTTFRRNISNSFSRRNSIEEALVYVSAGGTVSVGLSVAEGALEEPLAPTCPPHSWLPAADTAPVPPACPSPPCSHTASPLLLWGRACPLHPCTPPPANRDNINKLQAGKNVSFDTQLQLSIPMVFKKDYFQS